MRGAVMRDLLLRWSAGWAKISMMYGSVGSEELKGYFVLFCSHFLQKTARSYKCSTLLHRKPSLHVCHEMSWSISGGNWLLTTVSIPNFMVHITSMWHRSTNLVGVGATVNWRSLVEIYKDFIKYYLWFEPKSSKSYAGILLIGTLGTNFCEILIEINTISLKKMRLKMSSGK